MKRKHRFDPVHGGQEVFRVLLEALANPGRVLSLRSQADQFAGGGRWLAPALTLLDKGAGFFWDGDEETGEEIRFLSGAPRVPLEAADFVFLSREKAAGGEALDILSRVKAGTHRDPHDSALLFIAAGTGAAGTGSAGEQAAPAALALPARVRVFLTGPGVPPEGRRLDLFPSEAAWSRARDKRGFEYPCGVELVFLREDCSIRALTRKTEVSLSWPTRR